MIKILGRSSSINVRKVLWTCHELGIAIAHEPWGEGELHLDSPEFLRLNPHALAPVLVDGDFVLSESNSICRYLATLHPVPALLPREPHARALVEQWMDWQATELNNAWRYAFMGLVRKRTQFRDRQAIEASIHSWNHHMTLLDTALAGTGAFITGANFTLADIVLGLSMHRWHATPMAKPALKHVERFHAMLLERPGFRTFGTNGGP